MDLPVQSSHKHSFHPDQTIGKGEEVCDCGYWRCKHINRTTKIRCDEAAVGCGDFCERHHHRKNRVTEASGADGTKSKQPHTDQSQPAGNPKDAVENK